MWSADNSRSTFISGGFVKDILVVGSLAFDTVSTPTATKDHLIGGSANYFAMGASLFAPVRVVGVVGEDYDGEHLRLLEKRGVDTLGVQRVSGKTFHWSGRYEGAMNEAMTLQTELNVFQDFRPTLPDSYRGSPVVFLANIDPELQLEVLEQVESPEFVAADTMDFWIRSKKTAVLEVLKRIDALLLNEGEALALTGASNAIAALEKVKALGPKWVVIKRGEYGFVGLSESGYFMLPAYPIAEVVDPTGAGDTFASGFVGTLATGPEYGERAFRRACVAGCVLASFAVEDFSWSSIRQLSRQDLDQRTDHYTKMVSIHLST